mgnify:CR=1 FL=1
MISGTQKIWSKSGPVDLITITKMLQNIQENYGIILEKYYVCQSGTSHISKIFDICMSQVPDSFDVFSSFVLLAFSCVFLNINFENNLASEYIKHNGNILFLEDESQRIGKLIIPDIWYKKMKESKINALIDLIDAQKNDELVALIKSIVPEYLSQNSSFEKLDKHG